MLCTHQVKPFFLKPVHDNLKCFVGDFILPRVVPFYIDSIKPFLVCKEFQLTAAQKKVRRASLPCSSMSYSTCFARSMSSGSAIKRSSLRGISA